MKTEKSKHTPGPWKISEDSSMRAEIVAPNPEAKPWDKQSQNKYVASVPFGKDKDCRHGFDASLICAAPDLLDALELALTALSSVACNESDEIDNVKTEIANAINKAKGE